jgi:hypothetical protein
MNMLATTVNISQSGIAEECSEMFSIRALSSRETIVCSYVVEDVDSQVDTESGTSLPYHFSP